MNDQWKFIFQFRRVPAKGGRLCYDINHVHHTIYVKGWAPWQVPDEYLITLCKDCHRIKHESEHIPKCEFINGKMMDVVMDCNRCGGTGYLREFRHVQGGVCFKCGGRGSTKAYFISPTSKDENS